MSAAENMPELPETPEQDIRRLVDMQKAGFNVDGALAVLLTTRTMETLHTNVVVTKQVNLMPSLAQLTLELQTAVDSTATLHLTSAVQMSKGNSQLWTLAIRPALLLLNTRNATILQRNVKLVTILKTQTAKILELFVKQLAMFLMLSAMKLLAHVGHVTQLLTRTAQ